MSAACAAGPATTIGWQRPDAATRNRSTPPGGSPAPFLGRLALYMRRHGRRLLGDSDGERVASAADHLNRIDMARRFPSLRDAPGCSDRDGWSVTSLDRWASALPEDHPGRYAAQAVLADVFHEQLDPVDCGRFFPTAALAVWDGEHRAAYKEIAAARPWLRRDPRQPVCTSGVDAKGVPYWRAAHALWTIVVTCRRGAQRLTVTPMVFDEFDPTGPLSDAMFWLERTEAGSAWLGGARPDARAMGCWA